jgi:hypothetical protein
MLIASSKQLLCWLNKSQSKIRVVPIKCLIDLVTVAGLKKDKLDASVVINLFSRVMTQVVTIVPQQLDGITIV